MRGKRASGLIALAILLAPAESFAANRRTAPVGDDTAVYIVQKGDTLYHLNELYMAGRTALESVRRLNGVADPHRMPIGLNLRIPRGFLRYVPVTLGLSTFSGPVSVAVSHQEQPAQKGLELPEGSEIGTGANGYALLLGSEGSRIALPSNSHVRVERSRKYLLGEASDIEIAIDRGRAEVRAAKQAPGGRFRIKSPVAVTAVRGTIFRSGFDESLATGATEVLEGLVAVASPRQEIAVPEGFGASANKAGEVVKESLLAAPVLLEQGKVQTEELVSFSAQPVTGARDYSFEVARDAGFEDVVAQASSDGPAAEFPDLRNGTFFVRLSARAQSGLLGKPEIWSFRRQRVGIAAEMLDSAIPGGFRINWHAEGEGTSVFRFQLFGAGNRSLPMVDEAGLATPGITLTRLKKGAYFWRVGVVQTTPEGSAQVWTPMQKFTVSN